MPTLWGGNKNGEEEHEDHDENATSSQAQPRASEDATERTRLLPPDRQGYLSPDDPAVCVLQTQPVSNQKLISTGITL